MASKRRSDRLWRHALSDDADVRRAYPIEALERVEELIEAGEATHTGEVCVAIEPALPVGRVWRSVPPRDRALEVFGLLRVWDTEDNNGVLIYLLLADRRFEIIADRGIHRHVGNEGWEAIARQMEAIFAERRYIDAVEHGVRAITALLAQHFPGDARDPNQLPDRPVLLT
jgi:uncharacterized membrane protein